MKELELSKEEALRLAVAERLDYDVKKAKPVCDFVLGKDNCPNTFMVSTTPQYSDGIYYVLSDQSLIKADEETANTHRQSVIGVAVKMGEKLVTIALHDAADGEEVALTGDVKSGSEEFYHNDFFDAISDWDGEGNTKDYGNVLNPEIGLKEGQYIPSLAQLHLILMNIKAVNAALEAVGGSPLRKTWYWSSTEYSTSISWGMYFNDGHAYSGNKYYTNVVRPAVAYQFIL